MNIFIHVKHTSLLEQHLVTPTQENSRRIYSGIRSHTSDLFRGNDIIGLLLFPPAIIFFFQKPKSNEEMGNMYSFDSLTVMESCRNLNHWVTIMCFYFLNKLIKPNKHVLSRWTEHFHTICNIQAACGFPRKLKAVIYLHPLRNFSIFQHCANFLCLVKWLYALQNGTLTKLTLRSLKLSKIHMMKQTESTTNTQPKQRKNGWANR